MRRGFLSDYFVGIGAKRLADVEIYSEKYRQHEFNGISDFKRIFGDEKVIFHTTYIYLSDDPDKTFTDIGSLTWYDARENHKIRSEYRLYYTKNEVLQNAEEGDLIIVGKKAENSLVVIRASEGSTSEAQLLWLFGIGTLSSNFNVKTLFDDKIELSFSGRQILEKLGIEVTEQVSDLGEKALKIYGGGFPSTIEFSKFARDTCDKGINIEDPDDLLVTWLEHEESLFRVLEKHLLKDILKQGFDEGDNDVERFIQISLSVQNRRKKRAGDAFENHLAALFDKYGIKYSKGKKTERNNKPDFLFPGIDYYKNPKIPENSLTMLGVKTTAKDRWRQVLSEADRVKQKHLITLQPSISINQTNEMKEKSVQLVVPREIIKTYSSVQQKEIITVRNFIEHVHSKQQDYF